MLSWDNTRTRIVLNIEKGESMSVKNILSGSSCFEDRYIPDYDKLRDTISSLRNSDYKISMTQGVYDLLHIGHVRYIAKAKACGDILVVAVDTDEYTRKRKQKANERRPVVPFEERLELLSNIRGVDILTIRDLKEHEADPDFVIKVVKPDVLIMSRSTQDVSTAKHEELKALCGRLEILEPQAETSTSKVLRELLIDGAGGLVDCITDAIEGYYAKAGRVVNFGKEGKP
ncbi:adenylyltransferase/cytidyltransferase family protein [Patescibacteria group bacterium]|nr:adenylyltransferase/cytidyltransferase family protein [Patescibacteria group bacterium]